MPGVKGAQGCPPAKGPGKAPRLVCWDALLAFVQFTELYTYKSFNFIVYKLYPQKVYFKENKGMTVKREGEIKQLFRARIVNVEKPNKFHISCWDFKLT